MFLWFFNRPWLTGAMLALMMVMGVLGYTNMPRNLYPDAEYPQVMIITQFPGASAEVIAQQVSRPMERELFTLSGIRLAQSTNRDGFAVIRTEFEYEKGLEGSLASVTNALDRIRNTLPEGVMPFSLYPMGNFTPPAVVLAVTPKPESGLDLMQTRYLIESDIRPRLLKQSAIANVEVFGGWQPQVAVKVDAHKLAALNLSIGQVMSALKQGQSQWPMGNVLAEGQSWTFLLSCEKDSIDKLAMSSVSPNVRLDQIAEVSWIEQDRNSAYIGNGASAIALSIQRPPGGTIGEAYDATLAVLPEIQATYPLLDFSVTDTQIDIINRSNANMFNALLEAVLFVSLVMLIFLANWRAVATALLSLPLVFLGTMAVLWLFDKELNLFVTTGVILALGMLVDDAVVVLENIERHLQALHEDVTVAVVKGMQEIVSPIWVGTLATVVVLAPLMFVGGYTEQVFSHLVFPVVTAVFVSYLVSITFIPRLVWWWYRHGIPPKNRLESWLESHYQQRWAPIALSYVRGLQWTMQARWRRWLVLLGAFAMLVASAGIVMPTVGQDALPAADMGVVQLRVKFAEQDTAASVERRLLPALAPLKADATVTRYGVSIGAEPGVTSLGSGALASEASVMIHFVSRLERDKTSWAIADEWRSALAQLPGVVSVDAYDFGNTMSSTIKAPITLRLSSDDWHDLPQATQQVERALQQIAGVTSVSHNGSFAQQVRLKAKHGELAKVGLTPETLAAQLPLAGLPAVSFSVWASAEQIPVRVSVSDDIRDHPETLLSYPVQLPKGGSMPLNALVEFEWLDQPMMLSTDGLQYTVDLLVYRDHRALSHLLADIGAAMTELNLPASVSWRDAGDNAQGEAARADMLKGLGVGIILLTVVLVAAFASARMALLTVAILPLSAIGAFWGLMFFGKAFALPALLGIILLFSIIVKNGILLMEFIHQREQQVSAVQAAEESIRLRFRPILMTALATIAGMIPIALERSIGLERLSPLADVAIGGLLVGTVLSLLLLPMLYLWGVRSSQPS